MLIDAVVILGAIVIFQLWRVIGLLKASHAILQNLGDLKEEIRDARRRIEGEVQAANDLGKKLEEIQQRIRDEFQWHKKATFAHELREWLAEISNNIAGEIQSGTSEIVGSLSEIEKNTSGK